MTDQRTETSLSAELRAATLRLSRRLRREKADDELSDAQSGVLGALLRRGALTPAALSAHERVTPPSMNRTLNILESAGYVTRTKSEDDRRLVLVELTDAGRRVVLETRRRRDAWLDQRLAALDADELAVLEGAAGILRRMADQ
ncbi:MarR family transcriptional regulator [Herbiconiux sp. 11R-BC]|uniref:MarR family winged helix-turn-helix transcriptional regulator n=1 Tax=Herbiconiux sp. 11R-BC TaxID=3111637 RepID=UPI003BFAC5E2